MATVGLVAHDQRPAALEVARRTASWLEARGHRARMLDVDAGEPPGWVDGLDLALSLGGDGTMLRTVRLVAGAGVPILGVNLGHLGYLTVVEPDGLADALDRFLAGGHRIDARMTLDVAVRDGAATTRYCALNDVVLQRPAGGHTVRLGVEVGGRPFLSFAADAVIVATPTGSTAYNLSARGPIVSPAARVQVLTPVAPHSLFDRSIVFAAEERLAVVMHDDRSADLVIDGMPSGAVKPGQLVEVAGGRADARLVIFEERDFEGILRRKFHLSDP
jgi:NAD+ kinase